MWCEMSCVEGGEVSHSPMIRSQSLVSLYLWIGNLMFASHISPLLGGTGFLGWAGVA